MLAKDMAIMYWNYDVKLNPELTEAVMTVIVEMEVIPIDMYY